MKCGVCQDEIPQGEAHEHGGQSLCDDCYMDAMSPKSGCDPWAVYSASKTIPKDQTLTATQETILKLVEKKGKVNVPDLLQATGLDQDGLQREVVPLRHMELVVWERQPDSSVELKAFE